MAKKSRSRKFGLSGGKNGLKRKLLYGCRKYVHRVKSKISPRSKLHLTKLQLRRDQILRKYQLKTIKHNRNRKLFTNEVSSNDKFSFRRISCDDPFKFKIKRISSISSEGYRLINLNMLQNHMNEITTHVVLCDKARKLVSSQISPIRLSRELKNDGLASLILVECQGCLQTFRLETSPKLENGKTRHYDVNVRAVWGSMATGSGVSHLNEYMATLDSPGMSDHTYSTIESEIGEMWGDVILQNLLEAGAEERKIAMEKGHFHDGVPCITVVCDGGWSKRAHKHTYNALGGVAVIIGAETQKLLYIGVKNKYCYICSSAQNKNIMPRPHKCYKNWSESSQAMESAIILEGFLKAEAMHGLRYTKIIADGDSSVYPKLQENVPVWGKDIVKLECANHVCKCLRTNLEKLVDENPVYKGKNKLTKQLRIRLTSAVRCAIRLRSKEKGTKNLSKLLEHDIRNSVHHVFGNHTNCSNFCKAKLTQTSSSNSNSKSTPSESTSDEKEDNCSDVFQELSDIWTNTLSLEEEEESRFDCNYHCDLDNRMLRDISILLDRVASKSNRLIGNFTTNLAECWMSMRAKFDGGKFFNRCSRGSWHYRCFGGSLRKNLGPQWSPLVWEKCTSTKAGKLFKQLYERRECKLKTSRTAKMKPENKARRWKRKLESTKESTTKKARREYGPDVLQLIPDVSADELEKQKNDFLKNHVSLSIDKLQAIEKGTRKQSQSPVWLQERRKRITSSNFGVVVKKNPSKPVKKLLERLLYSGNRGNIHTKRGLNEESMTVIEYINKKKAENNKTVKHYPMGLIISSVEKYLATSPDGKIVEEDGQTGLIEIKNLLLNKPIDLNEAAKTVKSFCLEFVNNKLHLKKSHDYYYQVQGQLNITNYPWVDFVVRTLNPYQLHVERITIDKDFWTRHMLPKLKAFYFNAVLPELASPRYNTTSGIREPGTWFTENCNTQNKVQTKKLRRKNVSKNQKTDVDVNTVNQQSVPGPSTSGINTRSRRTCKIKFEGRRISHEWVVDEQNNIRQWYTGIVTGIISGKDGEPSAVYEILYDGDDEPYQINHLYEDYKSSSVKFIDL